MQRRYGMLLFAAVTLTSCAALAVTPPTTAAQPTIYITPQEGFETAITAGLQKKHVPVTVVTEAAAADYVLTTSPIQIHKESGAGKIARCLFAYCAGIEDSGNVSVQMVNTHTKAVVWAYNVSKQRGSWNQQSMAEAIAKHLDNDFLKKQK